MKLTYQCQEKGEKRYLEDFLKFKNIQIEEFVHCPDQTNRTEKSPDYYLSNLNMAIEIKKMMVEKWEQMLRTPDNRTPEIEGLINNLLVQFDFGDDLKKKITILCPESLNKIKKRKFNNFAQLFVEKLRSDKKIFQETNYRFEVKFVTGYKSKNRKEEKENLIFSVVSNYESDKPEVKLVPPASGGAIWVLEHIRLELEKMINEASAKFISFKSSRKILLLVDYYLGNKFHYEECLNQDMKIKLLKSNLDEIWIQFRRDPDILMHYLLWTGDKSVL